MNPFSSDKAPYVFALLVGLVGWFLTSAIDELRSRVFVHYTLVVDSSDAEGRFAELSLFNDSVQSVLAGVEVVLRCRGGTPCFRSRSGTLGDYLRTVITPPWFIEVTPTGTDAEQSITPRIPAGARLVVRANLRGGDEVPDLLFKVPPDVHVVPELSSGVSLYGLILRNYLVILFVGGSLSILVFIIWVLRLWPANGTERGPNTTESRGALS